MSAARERGQNYQEDGGEASVPSEQQTRHHRSRRRRIPSGFTYISGCVKYTMFFFNFIFWLMGLLLIGVSWWIAILENIIYYLRLGSTPSWISGLAGKLSS